MRKILLVDNDITFIWGLKKYLQRRGYAVETAATLAEAREMIKQEAPLLICSDPVSYTHLAGVLKMEFIKYSIASFLGVTLWNTLFVGAGYIIGEPILKIITRG